MAKLIIWCNGRPAINGYSIREFKWSVVYNKMVYEGREFEDHEFNGKWEKAFRNNQDLLPQVEVVQVNSAPVKTVEVVRDSQKTLDHVTALELRVKELESIPAASAHTEPTVEEAQALLFKKAPHMLRKSASKMVEI